MNLLKHVKSGPIGRPQRVVIYAPEGLGKTTLASQFPSPLFFDFEGGTHHLDVRRVEPSSLAEVESALAEIAKASPEAAGFRTVVIDTIDWLESLAIEAVCAEHKQSGIEGFGYGKGYVFLAERMTRLLAQLDAVKNAGFHVVLLAHSEIRKFEQPDAAGAYDRYQLKLEKKSEPLVKEWADALLFGNWKTRLAEKGEQKYKAVGGKDRVLFCNRSAAYDAKNRYGLSDEEPWQIETIRAGFARVGAPWEDDGADPGPAASGAAVSPPPSDPSLGELKAICEPHAETVNAFLLGRSEIAEGQTYLDVSPAYRARILRRPADFLKAAKSHAAAPAVAAA